jgi:hypothetical protein
LLKGRKRPGQIAVDFASAITDSGYPDVLKAGGQNALVAFKGADLAAKGTIEITAE